MEFELYYDYLCPFVYRASLLLANVAAEHPSTSGGAISRSRR